VSGQALSGNRAGTLIPIKSFQNKIALIIPDTAERMAKAEFMRTCMHLQGFQWEFFMAYEDAIDWLSDITEL